MLSRIESGKLRFANRERREHATGKQHNCELICDDTNRTAIQSAKRCLFAVRCRLGDCVSWQVETIVSNFRFHRGAYTRASSRLEETFHFGQSESCTNETKKELSRWLGMRGRASKCNRQHVRCKAKCPHKRGINYRGN